MHDLFCHFLLLIIFILLLYSCVTDILYRQIKNSCVLSVLVFSMCLAMLFGHINIMIPAMVLIIGFLLAITGMIGAGDIKLIVALVFSIPQNLILEFFFSVCCLGAPVSIMAMVLFNLFLKKKHQTVPFGVAISVGYIFTIWHGGVV